MCRRVTQGRAALAALAHRKEITPRIVAFQAGCRDTLVPLLAQVPGVQVAWAQGRHDAFFRIEAFDDSMAVAKRLVAEAGIRLAPGDAFEPGRAGLAALVLCLQGREPSGRRRAPPPAISLKATAQPSRLVGC